MVKECAGAVAYTIVNNKTQAPSYQLQPYYALRVRPTFVCDLPHPVGQRRHVDRMYSLLVDEPNQQTCATS